jgi:flavodoxin
MKTLIVYYSFTQNNEKLALHLREVLNCDLVKIETLKKRTGFSILFDLMFNRESAIKTVPYYLRDYDHVIFIAPIWAGRIAMPLKTFILNEKANIKQYSFVTLCGGRSDTQKSKIQNQLKEMTGKAPEKVTELWVSNLLPNGKKDSVKNVSGYRIDPTELKQFDSEIHRVLEQNDLVA